MVCSQILGSPHTLIRMKERDQDLRDLPIIFLCANKVFMLIKSCC